MERDPGIEHFEAEYQSEIVRLVGEILDTNADFELFYAPGEVLASPHVRQHGMSGVARTDPESGRSTVMNDWFMEITDGMPDWEGYRPRVVSLYLDKNSMAVTHAASIGMLLDPAGGVYGFEEISEGGTLVDWLDILRTTSQSFKNKVEKLKRMKPR